MPIWYSLLNETQITAQADLQQRTEDETMTTTKQIEMARKMLNAGNGSAYARLMSGSIRAAMSDRAAKAFRAAIVEDGAERFFVNLNTNCPLAA